MALTAGIFLSLLLVLIPGVVGWRRRENICALALVVAATASIIPPAIASDQSVARMIANPFTTSDYSSVPYINLVLMLSLWLSLSMRRQSIYAWIRALGPTVLSYLLLSSVALAGLFFYVEADFHNGLTPPAVHMSSILHVALDSVRQFGPAAVTVLLSFLLSLAGFALISRFHTYVDRGRRTVHRHLASSLLVLAFCISLQQSQLVNSFGLALQFSWQNLMLTFASGISALILWYLLRRRYGAGNINSLAIVIAALGLLLFASATIVALGAVMIILGGPLESIYRCFRRPDRTSLAFSLSIGTTAFFFFWVFNQRDILAATFPALLLCAATALVHPVDGERLPNSVLRRNQLRLRQVIYWSIAIISGNIILPFPIFPSGIFYNFDLGTGWLGTVADLAEFLFVLLLLASIGCAWIAGGWWAAATPTAVTWWGGLRRSEDAYGRYYATVGEIGSSAYPGATP